MKIRTLWLVFCTALLVCACDETTATLGIDLVPESDLVSIKSETLDVELNTIYADSVLARTNTCLLGNYTDPETGATIHSDYMMQLNCGNGFEFPDSILSNSCTETYLRLYFNTFVGDSLAPCRVSLYPLNKVLDNSKSYYTNIDPSDFYDASVRPIVTTTFTMSDRTISDADRNGIESLRNIRLKLPNEVGNQIIRIYREHPEYFQNGKIFNEKVNQGYYVKFEKGDGVMMDVYVSQLNLHYKYFEKSSTGHLDSLATGLSTFAGTEEVIQATSIKKFNFEKLLEDKNASYVKAPSSLFTEVTFPIGEVSKTDTINSAKLILDRYNPAESGESFFLPAPTQLLLLPKASMFTFFEANKIPDEETSFLATFSSKYNNYTFSNIAHLISHMRKVHQDGMAKNPNWEKENPDWNKAVLIPVSPVYSSSSSANSSYYYGYGYGSSAATQTVIGVNHDLSMSSAKLKKKDVKLQIIYSKFRK